MNILLVEDDPAIGRVLVRGLAAEGYGVNWRRSGHGARESLATGMFSAAILDLGLPDMDGLALCENLRRTGVETPLLMLTARATLQDKLDGFGAGADDYLTKPFAFEELLVRLNAVTRRGGRERGEVLAIGALRIDAVARIVSVGEARIEASKREFDLLLCLARGAGGVVTRDQILNRVWGEKGDVTLNTVDVYIGYLRQLLAPFPDAPRISTVRGVGYRLAAEPSGPKH
ncbi:response regulator transcription factor [Sphingomonas sp.]|uniref:response regulator transcription factor n=1 Tax=Sphingomonas sp. TaxID=28214 RepID=UPI000DB61205|nr:response regulator transcription factor [Sphingomonas sp.]PZU07244.1 MAG: two-component system response regulator [Sphingomonas sp.]